MRPQLFPIHRLRPNEEEFVIDDIVGLREEESGTEYKVRWYGYTSDENTFEPREDLPENIIRR